MAPLARALPDRSSRQLKQGRPGPRLSPLKLEILEDRTLLSATLVLDGPQTLVPLANVNVSQSTTVDHSEMTVDVNPTNPLNVAGFTHYIVPSFDYDQIAVYYSMDGGNSWSQTLIGGVGSVNSDGLGSNPSNVRFDPTIKFDANGNLYVAYGAFTGINTTLIVATSTDGGASFANSAFRSLDTQGGYGGVDKWYLATGPAGPGSSAQAVYVTWDHPNSRVLVAGSNDGGNTFTTPFAIDVGINGDLFSGPAVGPNGELYVTWESISQNKLQVRAKPDGLWGSGNWNTTVTVRNSAVASLSVPPQVRRGIYSNPSIDVDRSGDAYTGRVYLAFIDRVSGNNTDVYLSYSDDDGATWTDPGARGNVEDVPGASAFHSWVSVDQSTGSVNVLYRTNADGDPDHATAVVRVASSFDGGVTFPSKVDLSDQESRSASATYVGDFLDYTGFAVSDGTMHGFWSDNRGATPGTYASVLNSYTAMAGFRSATGANTLYVNGDDNGPTDDTIIVRVSAVNPDFLEVVVNGQTQYAGLMLSVNNIVVNGGAGNNTIVVEGSLPGISITLTAGDGRNLFITGATPAYVQGGAGDNILIGGSTQWDDDPVALAAIMAEWTRTDEAYADRVDHLLNGGGLNGSYLLNASTATGNGGGNTLLGNGGLNLYFGDPNLDYTDWDPNTETFVTV